VSRRTQHLLHQLPHVFHWRELMAMAGYTEKTTRVVLVRWNAEGLVRKIGTRSGLYENHRNPSSRPLWAQVVAACCGEATIVGELALYQAGWLETAPFIVEVALPRKRVLPAFDDVIYTRRRKAWWARAEIADVFDGVPILTGAAALVDLLAYDATRVARLHQKGLTIPSEVSIDALRAQADELAGLVPPPRPVSR